MLVGLTAIVKILYKGAYLLQGSRIIQPDASLVVALHSAFGEIGGGYYRFFPIHHVDLGMKLPDMY